MNDNKKNELTSLLTMMMERELQKTDDETDYEFVEFCATRLEELMGDDIAVSEEEIRRRCAEITGSAVSDMSQPKKKHCSLRRIIAVAAVVCIVLCTAVTVYAEIPELPEIVKCVLGLPVGESIEHEDFTYTHLGEPKCYQSIADFKKHENVEILYPVQCVIRAAKEIPSDYELRLSESEIFSHAGLDFYVICNEVIAAYTEYHGMWYTIQANSYDALIELLKKVEVK